MWLLCLVPRQPSRMPIDDRTLQRPSRLCGAGDNGVSDTKAICD